MLRGDEDDGERDGFDGEYDGTFVRVGEGREDFRVTVDRDEYEGTWARAEDGPAAPDRIVLPDDVRALMADDSDLALDG